MSSSKQRQLDSFYERLDTYISKGQYSKAVIVCDKILRAGDEDARLTQVIKTKCVCLIRQRKFGQALTLAEEKGFKFENAYCLYQNKKNAEAMGVLDSMTSFGDGAKNLKAQLHYRLGEYSKACDVYAELVSVSSSPSSELLANYAASSVLSGLPDVVLDLIQQKHADYLTRPHNYELVYNLACLLLATGNPQAAITRLDAAIELGQEFFSTDDLFTQEKIDSELAILRVQKGYALQKTADDTVVDEINTLYKHGSNNEKNDETVTAVAANNLLALRGDSELFDSYKLMRAVSNETVEKLPKQTGKTLWFNKALLLLKMQKSSECVQQLEDDQYSTDPMRDLIRASLFLREKKLDKAVSYLTDLAQQDSPHSPVFLKALAQISISKGEHTKALEILTNSGLKYKPEIVNAVSTLYEKTNQVAESEEYLKEALSSITNDEDKIRVAMLHGDCLLRQGKYQEAATVFENVINGKLGAVTDGTTRMEALANYVIASSYFDPSESERKAKAISIPPGVDAVDAEALDHGLSLKQQRRRRVPAVSVGAAGSVKKSIAARSPSHSVDALALAMRLKETKKKRQLKKRQKRKEQYLEKLKDKLGDTEFARHKPDPERWIPLQMRAKAMRQRRKRGGKLTGAQGVGDFASKGMAGLDARQQAQEKASSASTAAKKKKKKKKGRR